MGRFILLPDGTLLVINGSKNGTEGYATATGQTPSLGFMPYGMSLLPTGSHWSSSGLSSSNILRLYHYSSILLSEASVLVAG